MPSIIPEKDRCALAQSLDVLHEGKLLCFPTETIYALAADATSEAAVAQLYEAKKRDPHKPISIFVPTTNVITDFAYVSSEMKALIDTFMPGPITLVLPKKEDIPIPAILHAGLTSIGIRIPSNPFPTKLLAAFNKPIAATSVNISGKESAASTDMVSDDIAPYIALIIDGGTSQFGQGSTVIDGTTSPPVILRQGVITESEIQQTLARLTR